MTHAPHQSLKDATPPAPVAADRALFLTKETIRVTEQASPNSAPVTETYTRNVLHLVVSTRLGNAWRRDMNEYIIGDDAALARLRGTPIISRDELQKAHEKTLKTYKVRVTLDEGTYVESDSLNTRPTQPLAASFAPYELEPTKFPLAVFALTWPSVTPCFPASKPEKGTKWKGLIPVLYGACQFEVAFTMTHVEFVKDDPWMELAIEKQQLSAKVNKVKLTMTPTGSWKMRIDHRDALWAEAKGELEIAVDAAFRTAPTDPTDTEVKVLRLKRTFEARRIPIAFDEKSIFAAAWKE